MSQNVAPSNEKEQQSVVIPSNMHPWDVAVVYNSLAREKCGHAISWNRFQDVPQKCLYCQENILLICDPHSSSTKDTNNDTVFFKYNKQAFQLSIQNPKQRAWWDRRHCTAQERMAYALGMNQVNGFKVLCKGKLLYPNYTRTAIEISNQLLEISRQDLSHASSKPSLVVMGTRQGQGLHEPRQPLWSIVLGMGIALFANLFKLAYGTINYLYSYVKPLPPPEEGRDE